MSTLCIMRASYDNEALVFDQRSERETGLANLTESPILRLKNIVILGHDYVCLI